MQKKTLGFLLALTIPAFSQGVLYRSVAPDGSVSFSDTATAGSRPYDVMSGTVSGFTANTTNAMATTETANVESTASATNAYALLEITQPLDQTTFHNQSPISATVSVQPALKQGDKIKWMVDGVMVGEPQTSLQFSIDHLDRGTHQVQAAIIDANGATLKSSLPITLFKHQASLLLPIKKV